MVRSLHWQSQTNLRVVIDNILDNAIMYSRENGRVVLSCKPVLNRVAISIQDNGIGIPEEHHQRIFERFYRVDKARSRDRGGTGLGLSIVKHLVRAFGGEIELQSEVGGGNDFFHSVANS